MDLRTATGEKFILERAINRGGEAQIWTVCQDAHLVAKLYHKPTAEHQAKLSAMVAAPLMRQGSHPAVAWPLQLLYQQNAFVGYLMPRAANSRPLFHYYNPARRRQLGLTHLWPRFLHRTATNLARAVSAVHKGGHVIGDLNESNVLVTPAALVTLVDTDSFQIQPSGSAIQRIPGWLATVQSPPIYRCGVGKDEFTPPELQGVDFKTVDRTLAHDNFALAVLIFYLLMDGFHPFAGVLNSSASVGRVDLYGIKQGLFPYLQWGANTKQTLQPPPKAPPFAHLHPNLQDAFRRTFVEGHAHPARRVTAKEWKEILHEAEEALVACPQNAGHIYSRHLRHCPTCMPTAIQPRPTPPPAVVQPAAQPITVGAKPLLALSARWVSALQLASSPAFNRLTAWKPTIPQIHNMLRARQVDWRSYAKTAQSSLVTLPDRLTAAGQVAVTHAHLLGSWLLTHIAGVPLAALAAVGGHQLLPRVEQFTPLAPQEQAMLLVSLFAVLLALAQGYALRRTGWSSPYLLYGWLGIAVLSGAAIGAAGVRLLGPDWNAVSAWRTESYHLTTLAALFGLAQGFLQSVLLRQHLRLADDGRAWTIVNGISGILTAQGWLWGQTLPYTWPWLTTPDWQINAGVGAVAGVSVGALLSGGVLVWMVRGRQPGFHVRQLAFHLLRRSIRPARLRKDAIRWGRALLLLILVWCLLQLVAQLNGATAAPLPTLPDLVPHLAPLSLA